MFSQKVTVVNGSLPLHAVEKNSVGYICVNFDSLLRGYICVNFMLEESDCLQ